MDHLGPSWNILDHLGPYWTILDHQDQQALSSIISNASANNLSAPVLPLTRSWLRLGRSSAAGDPSALLGLLAIFCLGGTFGGADNTSSCGC